MLCEMPVLNLPTEITSSNDTTRDGTAVSTLRTANATANLYIGFVLDNLPTFENISKTRPDISFTLNPLRVSFEPPDGDKMIDMIFENSKFDQNNARLEEARNLNSEDMGRNSVKRKEVPSETEAGAKTLNWS